VSVCSDFYIADMRKIKQEYAVWKEGEFFVAQCLNVDISSFGETKEKAVSALHEALELYFEVA
jgi:predicted RNase H-like HicB family nuclease